MADNETPSTGSITWRDLTVQNASELRDFYSQVVGWEAMPLSMGDYDDYCMKSPDSGETVAGICHARGGNLNLPPQWLVYITVANLDESIERTVKLGGEVVDGPRSVGADRMCVIRDPAGAVAALFEKASK